MKNCNVFLRFMVCIIFTAFVATLLLAYTIQETKEWLAAETKDRRTSITIKGKALWSEYIKPIENPNYDEPLCVGDKVIVKSDNNGKIILQQINPYYIESHPSYEDYIKPYKKDGDFIYVAIMCENETHVLDMLTCPIDFFSYPNKYDLKLVEDKKFKCVDAYYFSSNIEYKYAFPVLRRSWGSDFVWYNDIFIWVDKETDLYCGGLTFSPLHALKIKYFSMELTPTRQGMDVYDHINDLYAYYIKLQEDKKTGYAPILQNLINVYEEVKKSFW